MATQIIHAASLSGAELEEALKPAVEDIRSGNVVAIPTETVYGLAANATNSAAVKKIYATKGRPSDNPLIVHVSSLEMLRRSNIVTEIPDIFEAIAKDLWPGPLTLIMSKNASIVPPEISGQLETIAVRIPSHPVARKFIELCDVPLAAPSANLSGKPSPTTAHHCLQDLQGRISWIIDGGVCAGGLESTVLNPLADPPVVLRPGGVDRQTLQKYFLKSIEMFLPHRDNAKDSTKASPDSPMKSHLSSTNGDASPMAPGMKYRHYSPDAVVTLIDHAGHGGLTGTEFSGDSLRMFLESEIHRKNTDGDGKKLIGLINLSKQAHAKMIWSNLAFDEVMDLVEDNASDSFNIGRHIFASLREMDNRHVDAIVVIGLDSWSGVGEAVFNRIYKAAAYVKSP
eukprot:Clim_evm34s136 gene=Clim_evmTU34s136